MILEHEIPSASKLYFGESAKIKRNVENVASDTLYNYGFQEIVTPIFSYHQHLSVANENELIKINDAKNNSLTLRGDSTIDVVRIIEKRLGKNNKHQKWFYIQPVFHFPTQEQYQVGAEFMREEKLSSVMSVAIEIIDKLEVKALVQISNNKIPQIVSDMFDKLSIDDFIHINIEKFLNLHVDWLEKLVYLQHIEQIDELLEIAPDVIKIELIKMKELYIETGNKEAVLAPMYYAKMLYYDELFFRVIDGNDVYARGGRYNNNNTTSVGFAIYTDAICEQLNR